MIKLIIYFIFGFHLIGFSFCNEIVERPDISNSSAPLAFSVLTTTTKKPLTPCVCGVFLSGQFSRGKPPKSYPVFMKEEDDSFTCNGIGTKNCQHRCLETMIKHLSNSPSLICGALDRDCNKERAYLFVKNCVDEWKNTNFSTGREYCCKDGQPYKCPIV